MSDRALRREIETWPDQRVVDCSKYFVIDSYQQNWF